MKSLLNPRRAICLLLILPLQGNGSDLQKLRSRGAEVYYLDLDLRAAYAKTYPTGLPEARRRLSKPTAAAFDWTTLSSRPFLYTQKVTPYCWAFAAVTAFEWNWAIRNGGPAPVLAVQPVIDFSKKEGGAPTSLAFEMLLQHGTCLFAGYPYTGKPGTVKPNAVMPYRAIAWGRVDPSQDIPEPSAIKEALLEQGPLVVSMYSTPLFEKYRGGVFQEHYKPKAGEQPINHAAVIVGWDDRKGKGSWKVLNSWGEKWGERGYMWIEYGSNNVGYHPFWVRAQSIHYQLPATANKQVNGDVATFHKWTRALALPAPQPVYSKVTVEEALKKPGQRVEVQFAVKGLSIVQPSGTLILRSERDPRDEKSFSVFILKSELEKFPIKEGEKLLKSYGGKTIKVRGSVQPMNLSSGKTFVIEVGDPAQIEVVEKEKSD